MFYLSQATLSRAAMIHLYSRLRVNITPARLRLHLNQRKMSTDTPSRQKISVAIVGAGVAGLRAAEVLLNANLNKKDEGGGVEYHVTVFESRGRIGGRVVTSEGIEGWDGAGREVDMGPNWIHGTTENPLFPYLPLTTPQSVCFDPRGDGAVLELPAPSGPKIAPEIAGEIFEKVMIAIARAEEYSRVFRKSIDIRWSLKDYLVVAAEREYGVSGLRDGAGDEQWEEERRRVGEFEERYKVEGSEGKIMEGTEGRHVGGEVKGSEGVTVMPEEKARVFLQMTEFWGWWVGEELGRQSLRWFILEEGMEGEQAFLASTYKPVLDLLSKPLLSGISSGYATLHLNTQVTHVNLTSKSQSPPQITVTTTTTSTSSPSSAPKTHTFDTALLCLPLGVLKHTHSTLFPATPSSLSLPPRALAAITDLGYGRLEKVYLRFENAWWPEGTKMFMFLEDDVIKTSSDIAEKNNTINPHIPSQSHTIALSLSLLPPPYSQPTLLFYLYGETSHALIRALASLTPASPSAAPEKDSPHFNLLLSFFRRYLSRLHSLDPLNLNSPQNKNKPIQLPSPTQIIHTTWSTDPHAGYGSYTQFPVGAADSEGDVKVLRDLGGKPHLHKTGAGGESGGNKSEVESGWDTLPIWLSGEFAAPRKGLGTVAGAWWSGGEKGRRVRVWFEGGEVGPEGGEGEGKE